MYTHFTHFRHGSTKPIKLVLQAGFVENCRKKDLNSGGFRKEQWERRLQIYKNCIVVSFPSLSLSWVLRLLSCEQVTEGMNMKSICILKRVNSSTTVIFENLSIFNIDHTGFAFSLGEVQWKNLCSGCSTILAGHFLILIVKDY